MTTSIKQAISYGFILGTLLNSMIIFLMIWKKSIYKPKRTWYIKIKDWNKLTLNKETRSWLKKNFKKE